MTDKPENPSAFPVCEPHDTEPGWLRGGMTLRDWFAGQALAGLMADGSSIQGGAAAYAYAVADALLAERAK